MYKPKVQFDPSRKVTLVKCQQFVDWYTIEWAEHENRRWTEKYREGVYGLQYSGRIADACVEGTAAEMRSIANAIEDYRSIEFYRCAATKVASGYCLWSPRNSQVPGFITLEQATHLVGEIRRVIELT